MTVICNPTEGYMPSALGLIGSTRLWNSKANDVRWVEAKIVTTNGNKRRVLKAPKEELE